MGRNMETIPNLGFKIVIVLWGVLPIFIFLAASGRNGTKSTAPPPPSLRDQTRDIIYETERYYLLKFDEIGHPLARTETSLRQGRRHLADAETKYFQLLQAIHHVKNDEYKFKEEEALLVNQCLRFNEVKALFFEDEERTFTSEQIKLYTQAKEDICNIRSEKRHLFRLLRYQEKLIDRYTRRLEALKSPEKMDSTTSFIAELKEEHLGWSLELSAQFSKETVSKEHFDQTLQNILNSWVGLTRINDKTYRNQIHDFDRYSELM